MILVNPSAGRSTVRVLCHCAQFTLSTLRFGKKSILRTLNVDEYRDACNDAFSYLGPDGTGLEALLDELRLARWSERGRNGGAQAILGGLIYDWLQRQSKSLDDYTPIKQRAAAYFYENIPIKDGLVCSASHLCLAKFIQCTVPQTRPSMRSASDCTESRKLLVPLRRKWQGSAIPCRRVRRYRRTAD